MARVDELTVKTRGGDELTVKTGGGEEIKYASALTFGLLPSSGLLDRAPREPTLLHDSRRRVINRQ